jgi:hypothetical protein
VIKFKDLELVELQEKLNGRNDLIEKDKIIAQNNVQIVEFENLQSKCEQKIVAKKYLIRAKH